MPQLEGTRASEILKSPGQWKARHEEEMILEKYHRILTKLKLRKGSINEQKLRAAFDFAMEAHQNSYRGSGERFIHHPLNVAEIIVDNIGLGKTSVICALLHDVVEDTQIGIDEIKNRFGDTVAGIVDGLTKLKGDQFEWVKSKQAENFRKLLLTFSYDIRVILIKLADRLDNMRTLDGLPRRKQLRIAAETMYVYVPLAHRLGLNIIKSELEDLYLKYTNPKAYYEIVHRLHISKDEREQFMKEFSKPITDALKKHQIKFVLKRRTKSIYSIWNKIQTKHIAFDQIYDLIALRIIVDAPSDQEKNLCWQVYSIVTDCYQPNPERLRDWISHPKSNGYESLHTALLSNNGSWVELQIRTRRMDDIAEKGYAAHWKYKEVSKETYSNENLDHWVSEVRNLLDQEKHSAIEFIEDFKFALYSEEIYVYTPKGDVLSLPKGASVLDFAFALHGDLGLKCAGGYVNGEQVLIDHVLHSGDKVEVITNPFAQPHETWLNMTMSSRARRAIKESLKEQRANFEKLGREILIKAIPNLEIAKNDRFLEQLREAFNENLLEDVYYKIGKGEIDEKALSRVQEEMAKSVQVTLYKYFNNAQEEKGKDEQVQTISQYVRANCCNPLPGEEVFGVITAGGKTKIHRTACPNALGLLSRHGNRIIRYKWQDEERPMLVGLMIEGDNKLNITKVMQTITEKHNHTLQYFTFGKGKSHYVGKVRLYLENNRALDQLVGSLKKIEGVLKITRLLSL